MVQIYVQSSQMDQDHEEAPGHDEMARTKNKEVRGGSRSVCEALFHQKN